MDNLHLVPESVTDQEACFVEPLAAACRIAEQQVSTWPLPWLAELLIREPAWRRLP